MPGKRIVNHIYPQVSGEASLRFIKQFGFKELKLRVFFTDREGTR